ncbi:hypothetical protein K2173_026617 [Erythroxylum novogranatense]|uniref:Glycosyl transferase CAP10 domain-containing protein n=1 Tax=Erythroxylum novogranatense TaxID=1862640 RepID=A0AAV8TZ33_9ROSI|nr:hypothetical protein K2173_026617 [Erythroxylum novogranatense]
MGQCNIFTEKLWRQFITAHAKCIVLFSTLFILVGAFYSTRLLQSNVISGGSALLSMLSTKAALTDSAGMPIKTSAKIQVQLDCTTLNLTGTCPRNHPSSFYDDQSRSSSTSPTCPDLFRWIHEDLRPWAHTGISRDMVERAKTTANFRLVILNGKAYLETFVKAFQTRDVFTLWGILQLLRKYPGKVPDLEMMFDCVDWPVVRSADYSGPNATAPPPLFRYCGDNNTLDVVFPDWSFWGWAETNIRPWEHMLSELKEGNHRITWLNREPYAYWKGNPDVAETRLDLMKCNVSETQDWNARVYRQDWVRESQEGYKLSSLGSQCNDRYKIYIEGSAWSVSQKYILACDSVTLIVKPHYYDFFSRSLMPIQQYWPIKEDDKCRSIKHAVEWGNSHKQKAQEIGKAASEFIQNDLKMDNVYDYMFHLLNQYSKLLTFKPTVPKNATELCSETMACSADGIEKKLMLESLVTSPSDTSPCTMPPPYDPPSLHAFLRRKQSLLKQVELREKKYWEGRHQ